MEDRNNIHSTTVTLNNKPTGMCKDCLDSLTFAKARTKELLDQINHAIIDGYPETDILLLKKDMWRWEAFIAAFSSLQGK